MVSSSPTVSGRFSIVVPSYQQGRFIRRTLESLLQQNDPDLEIIVQDGGSTDETVTILKEFSPWINWVSQRDGGQTAAINLGLKKATGECVGYLNSDDILYPGALARVREIFEQKPEFDFIYGLAYHIDEQDAVLEAYDVEQWNYDRLLQTCYLCQPATFWRKRVHEKSGYFKESLHFCMDYEFWLRTGKNHQYFYLPEVLAGARRHAEAKTSRMRQIGHREIVQIMPQYNKNHLPLKWARARAKTEAEAIITPIEAVFPSWCKYAGVYWRHLLQSIPQLSWADKIQVLSRLSPPYWSSRKQVLGK